MANTDTLTITATGTITSARARAWARAERLRAAARPAVAKAEAARDTVLNVHRALCAEPPGTRREALWAAWVAASQAAARLWAIADPLMRAADAAVQEALNTF